MKRRNILTTIIILAVFVNFAYAQFNEFANDVFSQNQFGSSAYYFMGNLKPERTDLSGGLPTPNYAYYPFLIVFVQFANEPEEDLVNWPIGYEPTYMNQLLSSIRKNNSNWWLAYNDSTESLSSYFHEISRGKMHVAGQ